MVKTKTDLKYSLQHCRKDVEIHKANGLAATLHAYKTNQTFWQKVNNKPRSPSLPTLVGVVNSGSDIVNVERLFQGNVKLYRWVCRLCGTLHRLQELSGSWNAHVFCCLTDITSSKLPLTKAPGSDFISAEHLLYAGQSLCFSLSVLFNMCIVQFCTQFLFKHNNGALYKNKNGNVMTDTTNYRPVTLATEVSKLLEHYILPSISPFLRTTTNLVSRLDMVLIKVHFCWSKLLHIL